MSIYLGIDCGTHSLRIIPFNREGVKLHAGAEVKLSVECIQNQRLQDPNEVKNALFECLKQLPSKLSEANLSTEQIAAAAVSGHMHTDINLKKVGSDYQVACKSTMWNCQSSAAVFTDLMKNHRQMILECTLNEPILRGIFTKTLRRKREEPTVWSQIDLVFTPSNYINFLLTGQFFQESSDAITAINPITGDYCQKLFEQFQLENKLPKLVESGDLVGVMTQEVKQILNISSNHEVKVYAGGGDQRCAQFGNAIVSPGSLAFNLGTSGVTIAYAEENKQIKKDPNGQLVPVLLESIKNVPAGANGLRFYPWGSGLNHPFKGIYEQNLFIADAQDVSAFEQNQQTRAVIEGVVTEMVLCKEVIQNFGISDFNKILLTGGAIRDYQKQKIIPQIFADCLQAPVNINLETNGSALGAAIIAIQGNNEYSNWLEACQSTVKISETIAPDFSQANVYKHLKEKYGEQYQALFS